MKKRWQLGFYTALFFSLILFGGQLNAQQPDISLEIDIEPILADAEMVELSSLSFDGSGQGTRIMNLFMQNNSGSSVQGLHLNITFSSQSRGTLLNYRQETFQTFSLNPGQSVYATNNDFARERLPGINENLSFLRNWTSDGINFVNSLEGSRFLPEDQYTITAVLYQNNNQIASTSATFGDQMTDLEPDLYLMSPGDIEGANVSINNPLPEFRWEGPENMTYRVIVVEEQPGDNPETLVQNARSTSPARLGGAPSLLDFEMMDVLVEGPRLQYPTTGVQPLQEGRTYYWQVFSVMETTTGQRETTSDIWSFRLGDQEEPDDLTELDEELFRILQTVLGEDTAMELQAGNYDLETLQLDDQELFGEMAIEELRRIIEKVQNGEARILRE